MNERRLNNSNFRRNSKIHHQSNHKMIHHSRKDDYMWFFVVFNNIKYIDYPTKKNEKSWKGVNYRFHQQKVEREESDPLQRELLWNVHFSR